MSRTLLVLSACVYASCVYAAAVCVSFFGLVCELAAKVKSLSRMGVYLAKMQAGAMTGAMMGMSTGTLAGNWALPAHGDDSMPCYYCM